MDAMSSRVQPGKGILAVAVALVAILVLQRLFRTKPDPREPPVLQPRVPFVGHIIGLATKGAKYFSIVSARCDEPIFSLPMLTGRTYVITSPNLASQVQRASKTIVFNPLILEVTKRMVGFDESTMVVLRDRAAKDEGRPQFMDRMHDMIYSVLGPSEITDISTSVLQQFTKGINGMPANLETGLFAWIKQQLTIGTSYTFWGSEHPFAAHPELIEPFWAYEEGIIRVMIGFLPTITARKAYYGREACVKVFEEYFAQKRYLNASKLVQERFRLHSDINMNISEKARSEMGLLFGALINAGVTIFWTLNNIFSRPWLLDELRQEITDNAFTTLTVNGSRTATISFNDLKNKCPLLNSVYRESLRLTAPMSSTRIVTEDTMVGNQYLLRANSVIQIAGGVIHHDPSVWGPDALSFNPRRFRTSQHGTRTDGNEDAHGNAVDENSKKQVHPAAFRAFGGGSVFCPGRHFAQVEILSLVAAVVYKYDLEPPEGARSVAFDPPADEERVPIGVMKPLKEVLVRMKTREVEPTRWVLQL